MEDPDPSIDVQTRTGGQERRASGTVEFAAIGLTAFGAVTLVNASMVVALGVYRLREWVFWAGLALLALYTRPSACSRVRCSRSWGCALAPFWGQKRTFTRAFE